MSNEVYVKLKKISSNLAADCGVLRFGSKVDAVYNPLVYAARPHNMYLELAGTAPKKIIFLGMNPGPWGMAQTGVPFGEIAAVRDWLGIEATVDKPEKEHPKRPIEGFACARSEVSGRRLQVQGTYCGGALRKQGDYILRLPLTQNVKRRSQPQDSS